MKKLLGAVIPLIILASCGSNSSRKLLIVANGAITLTPGGVTVGDTSNGWTNKEIDVTKPSLTVNNNGVKSTLTIPADEGYYICNISGDTLFGSQLLEGRDYNIGSDGLDSSGQRIMIDSVKKVLAGVNISAANKNYLITSGQIVKLSDDAAHTHVFSPFNPPTDIKGAADGKPVTMFKFYAGDELRQRLKTIEDSYNYNKQLKGRR